VPLPRKFMNFSSQNGVIWCILGVFFLRFMCPVDCSCMIKYQFVSNWGVVNTGCPLQVKYWGVATLAIPAELTPMNARRKHSLNNAQFTPPARHDKTVLPVSCQAV